MVLSQYAAPCKDANTGTGGRSYVPVRYQRAGRLTLMRVEAVLKALSNLLGTTSAEEMILGYKRVQGSFEGTSVGKEAAKEESDVLNQRRKIPPASPAPP